MSFKAVFQFILLIHEFKNVDLPNQGLAALSASIYKEENNKSVTFAIPYEYPFQRNYKLVKKKIRDDSTIDDMFFRTKVVMIKYSDETIPLDDFVQFRMQLEAFPFLNTEDVYLQLNLIFSNRYYASQQDKFDGKPAAQVKMKLKDIQNGIFSYYQADFKQDYFSKASFTLYGQPMYYKFEKYHIKSKQPSSKQIARAKIDNFGKLLIWSKQNYLSAGQDPFDLFYSNYVKNLRHSNYLIQLKLNNYLLIKRKVVMKVSTKFLQAIGLANSNVQITDQIFRQYLQSYRQPLSLDDIPQQIHEIRIDNFQFLNSVIEDLYHDQFNSQKMKNQYECYIKQKFGERVFKNTLYQFDPNYENALKQNKKIAKQMRHKNISLTEYPIQNQVFFNNKDDHEFIFYELTLPQHMKQGSNLPPNQQVSIKLKAKTQNKRQNVLIQKKHDENSTLHSQSDQISKKIKNQQDQNNNLEIDEQGSSSNNTQQSDNLQNSQQFFSQYDIRLEKLKYTEKNMLIVMCHGFQGSSYDMALIHKGIKVQLPNANYLLSRKNQDDTQGDIEQMGEKLADQIKYHIRAFMDQETTIINFVGHSMGGIIARASFRHLAKYKDQFGFYCSLSSPHLGYLNGVDNKIKAGLWVLRKWKPIVSLDQLSMEETKNPRTTFLYKLSKIGTLKYFRKIIFFSSFEDSYVSWHSARVSYHTSKNEDSKIENEMVQNILGLEHGKNKQSTIHRLDINFNVKGNNIDSLIGRAAHINLIIQDSLFDVINATLPDLFNLKEYSTGLTEQTIVKVGSQNKAKKQQHSQSSKVKFKEGYITRPRIE